MIKLINGGVFLFGGVVLMSAEEVEREGLAGVNEKLGAAGLRRLEHLPENAAEAARGTITARIIAAHDSSASPDECRIRFDSLASHDITYVGIIQTAIASGMKKFPMPYVLTNCHNSLCAVGGGAPRRSRMRIARAHPHGSVLFFREGIRNQACHGRRLLRLGKIRNGKENELSANHILAHIGKVGPCLKQGSGNIPKDADAIRENARHQITVGIHGASCYQKFRPPAMPTGCRVLPGGRPPRFASPLRSGQGDPKQDEQDVQDRQDGSPLRVT